jgi:hypothetical protein
MESTLPTCCLTGKKQVKTGLRLNVKKLRQIKNIGTGPTYLPAFGKIRQDSIAYFCFSLQANPHSKLSRNFKTLMMAASGILAQN